MDVDCFPLRLSRSASSIAAEALAQIEAAPLVEGGVPHLSHLLRRRRNTAAAASFAWLVPSFLSPFLLSFCILSFRACTSGHAISLSFCKRWIFHVHKHTRLYMGITTTFWRGVIKIISEQTVF